MDWNKTKTIFIIVFLILDAFLLYQYIDKRSSLDYDYATEPDFQDRLKENGINVNAVPTDAHSEKYIIAKSKVFKKEDFSSLKTQKMTINDGSSVYATLKVSYKLSDPKSADEAEKFVRENVLNGDEYRFWNYSAKDNTILMSQTYNRKVIYLNDSGQLKLFLNKQNQIYAYSQTFLSNIEEFKEKEEIISAMKAVETLFNKGKLPEKSKITKVTLGYYTVVPVKTASQVLTPTWHITVDDNNDFFVNAIEGQIFQVSSDEEKLE
ncbi:two-component system regulatory protein YycI [Peribacillus sp. SCS-37]|uniref:two-component system regulatory protein YycI n=1 Tax=Paraperibacillus esterisolvens TaxID=3115296 RepID=UPI003905E769